MNTKKWQVLSKIKEKKQAKTEDILEILLDNRGLRTKSEIEEFLNPKLESVTPKSVEIDLLQLKKTLQRVENAVDKKEKIIIFGDYDVDGICGTAILWETLYQFTKDVVPYIPHRIDEGYGLSKKGIENLIAQDSEIKLIITVDNGIVSFDAVEFANKNGIDIIITDHHVPSKKLPKAYSIVHTTRLCGTGVAYLLAQEIQNLLHGKVQTEHLSLVALATVADLVPLQGANRTLLKFGLQELRKTKRMGLLELFKEAAIDAKQIGTYEIGHVIAPRLNAMGRLEYAMDSLRLICTKDRKRAQDLAQLLGTTNKERQLLTAESVAHALQVIRDKKQETRSKLIFISHESYQPGVIGLVAGRLVEEFYLPSIVVSIGDPHSKASARSISGFNIIEFIRSSSDLLVDVGGHPMAAGFTVETKNLKELQKLLENLAEKLLKEESLKKTIHIDCELPLDCVSPDLYEAIQELEPFGMANYQPVFLSRNLKIIDQRLVGKENKHIKLKLQSQNSNAKTLEIDGIGFGLGDRSSEFKMGNFVDVVYSIDTNEWNGNKRLQLKIKDIKQVEGI